MHVLICDDRRDGCEQAHDYIRQAAPEAKCEMLHSTELSKVLYSFFEVVSDVLDGKSVKKTKFDDFDIIILDNNLAELEIKGARLTAESIAGYIRIISAAPYLVSLNKNLEVDFDLRFLVGDYATRADLALNTQHLANPALWSGVVNTAKDGFRPWYWPVLQTVAKRRANQVAFVRDQLDRPMLSALGFEELAINALSRHARGALSPIADSDKPGAKPLAQTSFRDFFLSSSRSLPGQKERETLSNAKNDAAIAQVVACELEAWFRRDVLGPQNVIVDLPHLALRMPFLLGQRAKDLGSWNALCEAIAPPFGLEKSIFDQFLAGRKCNLDIWLPAPAFWWQPLKDDEKLNNLFLQKDFVPGDFVFCEDTSTFAARAPENGKAPSEFAAEYEGSGNRRHVARIGGYKYAPLSRLAV